MEQTAIDWLKKIVLSGNGRLHLTDEEFEQAKQMEKEQIEEAYELGWFNGDLKKAPSMGKDYYEDKYSHPDPSDDETFNNFNHEGGIKYDN